MNFPLIPVLAVTTTIAVVGAWWLFRTPASKAEASDAPMNTTVKPKVIAVQKTAPPIRLVTDAAGLSPAEFSLLMQNLVDDTSTEARKAAQEGLTATCNLEQALEFAKDQRKRTKANLDPKELRAFLTKLGARLRGNVADGFLQHFPQGTTEMDSLLHGWAREDGAGAVSWFQALPQDFPVRMKLLQGLIWGMTEKDPAGGLKFYQSLRAPEQKSKEVLYGLSNALLINGGCPALNNLLALVRDDKAFADVLEYSLVRAAKRPPEEFIPWAADYVTVDPKFAKSLKEATVKWKAIEPENFQKWWASTGVRLPAEARNIILGQ